MPRIMVIIDGLEDIEYPQLSGKTPFEAGKGGNFAKLERAADTGWFITTPPDREPDTMVCIFSLLGVPPQNIPTGRAYLEGIARKLPIKEKDLVVRTNFVKLDQKNRLIDPTCSIPKEIGEKIRSFVADQGYSIHQIGSYKNLTIIPDCEEPSAWMTYPPHQHLGEDFFSLQPKGNSLAEKFAELSKKVYEQFAPYAIMNWGVGTKPTSSSFEKIHGLKGAMVSKTDIVEGIARAMGITSASPSGATGDTDTSLGAKAQAALELSKTHNIVIVHIGGTDEATHRKSPTEKAEFIGRIDREFLEKLIETENIKLLVTSDHGALCSTGEHTSQPTRFWTYDNSGSSRDKKQWGTLSGNQAINLLTRL